MANLRVIEVRVVNSTEIKASFTEKLSQSLLPENIFIESNISGVPDPEILTLNVKDDVLIITTKPLTPFASYFITFKSTQLSKFKSLNGQSFILEDGQTNVFLIIGAEDPDDPIRDNIVASLKDNIYNLDSNTLVRTVINSISKNLTKALHDIGQSKNDNYLQKEIIDEPKVRGSGPYDRLNEEGAYEILRVGQTPTNEKLITSISFTSFPFDPITLQKISVSNEKLILGDGIDVFNRLILEVKKAPVTRLISVKFFYQTGLTAIYNISSLGYQINNPKYDTDHASTLLSLSDSQFKLNDSILDSGFILPSSGDYALVSYEYKSLGMVVDETSVTVSQVLDAIREVVPPLFNNFTLQHPLIVNANDIIASVGGVQFLDPNANPPFSIAHPAFIKELPFKLDGLPSRFGEYSIDYLTGRVFVYGADSNDGSGNYPPIANYKYRNVFNSRLDYTYNPDTLDLVANPSRDLPGISAKITFNFENALIPGTDYSAQIHTEQLAERVDNRLKSSNSLSTKNSPITNVFRIFNETSGEIYVPSRWNDNTIFFSSNQAPRILNAARERAFFIDILNETLIVDTEIINISSVKVFKCLLQNNNIMSATEDVIGSSFNSSSLFSRSDIFSHEIFFDGQLLDETTNISRLSIGTYQIDYRNGIIYVGVTLAQNFDIGTVSYKKSVISPTNPHVIAVSQIYNSLSQSAGINKLINYVSFDDGQILPSKFDVSDERFLNNDTTLPYIFNAGNITVSDNIKDIRHIFDAFDLNNNDFPIDFAEGATFLANIISLLPFGVAKQEMVLITGGNKVVVSAISPGIQIGNVISVTRISDGVELYDNLATITVNTITLSGTGSPSTGQSVLVNYSVIMNGAATPIVDYNRGDYFVDYTYVADEVIVSYEYGDNVIDFRNASNVLSTGNKYYVSYKCGALRDALLKNFGTLVDISIINTFDITLSRENYRDALTAALQSFTKGPTIEAIKQIVSNITKIDPEIIESIFQSWSLGVSCLYLSPIKTTGNILLFPAKFDNGVLIDSPNQTISFPTSSNLRLEQGTLETWIIPEWNGLDNDATLSFKNLTKDGYDIGLSNIYIGASSFNPNSVEFSINKNDIRSPIGLPSAVFTKGNGLFVYYDDISKRWKILAKDKIADGYIYSGTIFSSGEVYDVKFLPGLGEIDDVLRSFTNKIDFEFHIDGYDLLSPDGYVDGYLDGYFPKDGYTPGYSFDGITFMADDEHYIFDFAEDQSKNRFSIYKDGKGYLNFQVFDRGNNKGRKNSYKVSADISNWKAGQKHHVATSWKINSSDRRDEMHLFIDGLEVPNILRYGGRPIASSTDRFRTVAPEVVAGSVPLNTVAGNDLITQVGSNIVTSGINFSDYGIVAGGQIEIREIGFGTYTILTVSGMSLTLSSTMPISLNNARFSINPYSVIVTSEIDLYSNITVSVLRAGIETEIPGVRAVIPGYEISKNIFNQNVLTILGNAEAGDQILIRTLGLNHRRARDKAFIWGNTSSVLKSRLPPPINLDQVKIIPILLPLTSVGPNNSIFGAGVFTATGISTSQPSNATEGRTLNVRIAGTNTNFSTPVSITIHGTTVAGPLFETLVFNSATTKNTVNKFKTISSVGAITKPFDSTKNSAGLEVRETFSITNPESNNIFPVIRFSYKVVTNSGLSGTSGLNILTDLTASFLESMTGDILVINSPGSVAGTYTVVSRIDEHNITVNSNLSSTFTNGNYDVFNITLGRSGFQNGFFFLEKAGSSNEPFLLKQGLFEFDYPTYLEIPFDPIDNIDSFVGSDFNGNKQAKAVLDEFRILSRRLTDTRIGETIADTDDSITTDFNSFHSFRSNNTTLTLLHFDTIPLINSADFWVSADRSFRQSASSVNSNFNQSLLITDTPLILDNKGLITTNNEGSIEFWVSPQFDTYNDPNFRFYFDASGTILENTTSKANGVVKINGKASKILSVRLATDIYNDGIDYFASGKIGSDSQTILLNIPLPFQQTPVKINYIPSGLNGDRISIYKDQEGFITFNIRALGIDYQLRQPAFWQRDTWHRIRATFKLNRRDHKDELRLFVDGEEKGIILFGTGLLFGSGIVFGQANADANQTLVSDINFHDSVNQIYIGSDYFGVNTARARIDNLRFSNIARSAVSVAGQPKDVNFSSNTDIVFPVVPDAFTTFLLNFDTLVKKTDDFTLLKNKNFGIFDFTLNIIDSFNIVKDNAKLKQILETLIKALKPAQSKTTINYIR